MSSYHNISYKHNHYVPEWYQKKFLLCNQRKYWYLDLKPDQVVNHGHRFTRRNMLHWAPTSCFAEDDLYTVKWAAYENVDIEKFFFGRIDSEGKSAVEFFSNFSFDNEMQGESFSKLLNYMSVQKLRTPKGLGWLSKFTQGQDKNSHLILLQRIQQIYCATWTECIWQIADAEKSPTKFIISDHPVTVYNRGCFPQSKYCKDFDDPDVSMVATHTYFPLSIDKILILTNLSWVRNPYQNERNLRPNPALFRNTIFKFTDIQIHRSLDEQEVLEINFITKNRALRYIAGAQREWLYPENYLRSTHWSKLGRGLLLMPEPRDIYMGGEVLVGYEGGGSDAWSEYGHRPWEKGYRDEKRNAREGETLERFKAEWSASQGREYRGTSFQFGARPDGPYVTPDEFHRRELERARNYKRKK